MKRILTAVGSLALVTVIGVTAINGVVDAQTPSSNSTTSDSASSSKRDEFLSTLAGKLGVTTDTLQTAIQEARDEVGFGPFGGRFFDRIQERRQNHRDHALNRIDISEAATFLGISEDELQTELQSGKTPIEIARDHGKTDAQIRIFLIQRATEAIDTRLDAAGSSTDSSTTTGA